MFVIRNFAKPISLRKAAAMAVRDCGSQRAGTLSNDAGLLWKNIPAVVCTP